MTAHAVSANDADSFVWWAWIGDHHGEIWTRTQEHVLLTIVAIAVGSAISAALSLVALRFRWTYAPITWIGGILYTIPSLALFGFLVPITGFGMLTAEIALVSYTILILVRNTVAGLDGVPTAVRDAADGMGFAPARRLLAVDLPLAMPTIVAGLRIASVTVVGLVTVAALVGIGGYGAFINDGLSRQFSTPIVLGTALSVVLAVVVDIAFVGLLWVSTPWRRRAARGHGS